MLRKIIFLLLLSQYSIAQINKLSFSGYILSEIYSTGAMHYSTSIAYERILKNKISLVLKYRNNYNNYGISDGNMRFFTFNNSIFYGARYYLHTDSVRLNSSFFIGLEGVAGRSFERRSPELYNGYYTNSSNTIGGRIYIGKLFYFDDNFSFETFLGTTLIFLDSKFTNYPIGKSIEHHPRRTFRYLNEMPPIAFGFSFCYFFKRNINTKD